MVLMVSVAEASTFPLDMFLERQQVLPLTRFFDAIFHFQGLDPFLSAQHGLRHTEGIKSQSQMIFDESNYIKFLHITPFARKRLQATTAGQTYRQIQIPEMFLCFRFVIQQRVPFFSFSLGTVSVRLTLAYLDVANKLKRMYPFSCR